MSKLSRRVRRIRRKVSRKLPLVGLAVLGVATVGVVAFSLSAGQAPTAAAPIASAPASVAPVVPAPRAVILGDSYTSGSGADDGGGYARLLARDMGWNATILGQGGTGYTNAGQAEDNEAPYGGRVADVIAAKPDIILIQGSTNDYETAKTQAAAAAVFAELRAALPETKIVAVGPLNAPGAEPKLVRASAAGVAAAATAEGVTFIDPIALDWMPDDSLYPDGVHPSQKGHRMLANNIRASLAGAGITPAP